MSWILPAAPEILGSMFRVMLFQIAAVHSWIQRYFSLRNSRYIRIHYKSLFRFLYKFIHKWSTCEIKLWLSKSTPKYININTRNDLNYNESLK